jgi:hypothetical protein
MALQFRGFSFSRIDRIRESKNSLKIKTPENTVGLISTGVKIREIKNQQYFQKADSRNSASAKIKRYTVCEKLILHAEYIRY